MNTSVAPATVIVPAHNEEAVIDDCLTSLLADAAPQQFDVIVACNGCSDATAELARQHDSDAIRVTVLEIAEASKTAALNAAIDAAQTCPLVFVDADVNFSPHGVRELCNVLSNGQVLAAAPSLELDQTGSSWLSRSYHRFWEQLPSIVDGLAGRGVYALSDRGLDRLGRFPPIIADDRYIHMLFKGRERQTLRSVTSSVAVAQTARDLVNRKARVFAGNNEISAHLDSNDDGSWTDVLRGSPRSVVDLPAYLGLNLLAKIRARKSVGWNRDESSRSASTQ